jgi:hypothetical protein
VFEPDAVGIYHCWNRLVQRRHPFGLNLLTGRFYSYRKTWVRDRLKQLAGGMAIDVLDYAILGNHLHVVLRNRPDLVSTWSDEEVARRWCQVCPLRRNEDGGRSRPAGRWQCVNQRLLQPDPVAADFEQGVSADHARPVSIVAGPLGT